MADDLNECADRLTRLVLNNQFLGQQELNDLMSDHSDDNLRKLRLIFETIGSKGAEEVYRFVEMVGQSRILDYDTDEESDGSSLIPSSIAKTAKKWFQEISMIYSDSIRRVDRIVVKTGGQVKPPSDDCYRMAAKPRGYCIIINNMKFKSYQYRVGSKIDELRLKQVFRQLGFNVKVFINLSAAEITAKLKKYAGDKRMESHDALVVIILSHGIVGDVIIGSDDKEVKVESLFKPFNPTNCRQLIDKPKIFFINACRGEKKDHGHHVPQQCHDVCDGGDRPKHKPEYSLTHRPSWSDFFVFYSTTKDYVSLRNAETGSVFCYELVKCLAQWSDSTEFFKLVTHKVAKAVEQRQSTIGSSGPKVKQAIETRLFGSIKDLYLNPGHYEQTNGSVDSPQSTSEELLEKS